MNINHGKSFFLWLTVTGFVIFSLGACAKKMVKKTPDQQSAEATEDNLKTDELDIHGKDFVGSPANLETVYFDYDSSELSNEARAALSKNSEYLKQNTDLEILSEGHCDERGTISYNLALGQKRAASVRKYYISMGLDSKRIGTLSFGKEKPVCQDSSEDCWAKNRRVETKIRTIKVSNKSGADPNP